jgi:hypothetical protein
MERRINMSTNELDRLDELKKVHEKRQTVAQAAVNLGLSKRQVLRLSRRLRLEGPVGLVSRKVGAQSNHQLPDVVKTRVLELIFMNYRDFGPTLAHEYLTERDGLQLSIGSVRNIMIENEIWSSRRVRKQRVFQLRPRRSRKGELIQLDGSEHDWFEGRASRCTLLVFVDDATSDLMHMRFVRSENLVDYFIATRGYLEKFGRPAAVYTAST